MTRGRENIVVTVQPSGKVTLPAALRRRIGLENGGSVVVRLEDDELRIRTVREVMRTLQSETGTALRAAGVTVDGFLAERRNENERARE